MRAALLVLTVALAAVAGCRLPPTPAVFRDDFREGIVTPDTNIGDDYTWSQAPAKGKTPPAR